MVKLAPVPLAGLPPVAIQAKVYGDVPPVAEAEKASGEFRLPVVGPLIVTARMRAAMVAVADAVAVLAGLSLSVRMTVIV